MSSHASPNGSSFFFGDFPMCGCGCPDKALATIRDALLAVKKRSYEELVVALGGLETGPQWLSLYAIDHAKLIEHGSAITSSWLTSKGEAALAYLEAHGVESDRWDHEVKIEWED